MTTTIFANVIAETAKAYQVEVLYKFLRNGSEKTWKAWVPKSQVSFERETTIIFFFDFASLVSKKN